MKIPGFGIGLKATLRRTRLIVRNALGLKPQVRTAFTANSRAIRNLASRFTCCYVAAIYTDLGGSTSYMKVCGVLSKSVWRGYRIQRMAGYIQVLLAKIFAFERGI